MCTKKVDIIIPVYNAYNDLLMCFDSIKKWTNLNLHRVIFINDCSPDKRVAEYLDSIKSENVIIVHNEKNMGFSANINIGISQSMENDILMLNSDTVVTEAWIEKMIECAYSDPWIATVTPLSNNATLCSVPYFCEENKLPDGYDVDSYAKLVEKVSMNRFPTIPVGHGFCMYIKREVIKKIGNFDAKTFGKGYGEENDFCYRAIEIGYHHVMCDNTFILHTGTSSFLSKDKQKLIMEHEKILDERYPDLMQDVRIHCRDIPTGIISHNVRFRTAIDELKERKTIMYLVQSDFKAGADDNIGGTQLHVKDLTHGLKEKYNILVVARNYTYLNVTLYAQNKEFFLQYYIGEKNKFQKYRSSEMGKLYGKILDAFSVSLVHIHHTLNMTLELYYEAQERNIPIFTTLHDYYAVCPNIKLLNENNDLCVGCQDKNICKSCLKKQQGISSTVDYISEWRNQYTNVLSLSQTIIVPSESAKSIIIQYYPELKEKTIVIGHGGNYQRVREKKSIKEKSTLNIAFLGAINVAKGYQNAIEMIKESSLNIKWHLFGCFERKLPELDAKKNFVDIGMYEREDLQSLVTQFQIDLICILPIWPETFCYTLSEAVGAGVPVLVTDIGALGERVRAMGCGWTVPVDATVEEVLKKIENIISDKAAYQEIQNNVNEIKMKTVIEMSNEYDILYEEEISKSNNISYYDIDNEWFIKGYLMTDDANKSDLAIRLAQTEQQLHEIQNAFTYKLFLRAIKIPIPFRKQIKRLFKFLLKIRA